MSDDAEYWKNEYETAQDGINELRTQLTEARDAWARYDRLGGRVKDAQDLDRALTLNWE